MPRETVINRLFIAVSQIADWGTIEIHCATRLWFYVGFTRQGRWRPRFVDRSIHCAILILSQVCWLFNVGRDWNGIFCSVNFVNRFFLSLKHFVLLSSCIWIRYWHSLLLRRPSSRIIWDSVLHFSGRLVLFSYSSTLTHCGTIWFSSAPIQTLTHLF